MFHWICPECGREIPPTVRECQACDPKAAAPVVEPVESTQPLPVTAQPPEQLLLVEANPVADLKPTPEAPPLGPIPEAPPIPEVAAIAKAAPVAVSESVPVVEPAVASPAVAAQVVPAPAAASPIAEPVVEAPAVVPEASPTAEPTLAAEPVAEKTPTIEAAPVVESPVPAEVVEKSPAVEAAPIVDSTPVVETLAIPAEAPVAETPSVAETIPVEAPARPVTEPVIETLAVAEAAPAESIPVLEASTAAHVPIPAPVAEATPAEPVAVSETQEPPIKLHDVPDPLLALAEEIRAAQAARAAALVSPSHSNGLLELAEVVGVQQPSEQHAEAAAPVSQSVEVIEVAAPLEKASGAEPAMAVSEVSTAVALLAPPEIAPIPLIETEPVGYHELRPAALAPEPPPSAEPEPVALAEPQVQPAALAPEPQPLPEPEGPTLPFAPMQDYTPATSRSIMPVPPRAQILAADSGPRITLPGPTLPPELTRLQDANVVTVIGEDTAQRTKEAILPPKSAGAPGWLVSVLVMLLLLAAGLGIVFYLLPHTVADAKPAPTPAIAATGPVPTGGNSPLAKLVEVTGFRIVTPSADAIKKDPNKKSEVQYLIVNHSDADISDANVFVTLRSAKPGQAPVCRFSFKVPSLGPFESKEMSSPIGNSPRAVSLPDWQDLRAEVQISQ